MSYFVTAADHAGQGWAKERAFTLYSEAFTLLPEGDERRREPHAKRAIAYQALLHLQDAARLAGGAARSVNVGVALAVRRFVLEREVGRRDVADDLPDRVGVPENSLSASACWRTVFSSGAS